MRTVSQFVLLLALICATPACFASDIFKAIPPNALLRVEIRDFPQLLDNWQASPFYRMWRDQLFAAFFAPSRQNLLSATQGLEKATGIAWPEIKQLFPGQAIFFCPDWRMIDGKPKFSVVFAARTSDGKRALALAERLAAHDMPTTIPIESEALGQSVLYRRIYRKGATGVIPEVQSKKTKSSPQDENTANDPLELPLASGGRQKVTQWEWCLAGDTLFIAKGLDGQFEHLVKNYQDQNAKSSDQSREWDISVNVNFQALYFDNNSGFPTPENIRPLHPEDLRTLTLGAKLTASEALVGLDLQTIDQPTGVAALLSAAVQNPFNAANYVPLDAVSFSSFIVEPAKVLDLARDIAGKGKNSRNRVDEILTQASQLAKVDVNALVRRMEGEVALFMRPAPKKAGEPPALETCVMVAAGNEAGLAEGFARVVEVYLGSAAIGRKMQPDDYKGFKVYSLKTVGDTSDSAGVASIQKNVYTRGLANGAVFAVARGFLIVSPSAAQVRGVLDVMHGEGASLAQNAAFKQRIQSAGVNLRSFTWQDQSITMQNLGRLLSTPTAMWLPLARYMNLMTMPAPETVGKHFGERTSWSESSGNSYRLRSRFIYPVH